MHRSKLILIISFALISAPFSVLSADGSYALTNANLFDGIDDDITENATVFVKDGLIERIESGAINVPSNYTIVDVEATF